MYDMYNQYLYIYYHEQTKSDNDLGQDPGKSITRTKVAINIPRVL